MTLEDTEKVLELVVFKTRPGVTQEELLGTVDAVSAWVKTQPGFLSRDLSYSAEEERWIEVIWWRSLHEAKAAAAAAMSCEAAAPMFGLIDMDAMLYLHGIPAIMPVLR